MDLNVWSVLWMCLLSKLFCVTIAQDEDNVEAITTNDFTTELSTERPMSVCMDKAIYHNNDCCFYTNGTYNYDGATMACDSLGGHLIKLVPSDLYNMLKMFYSPKEIPDSWIGLRENSTDIYIWDLDGEILTDFQSNWDVNEPSMPCVYIIGSTGLWKTDDCARDVYDAICCVPETLFNETSIEEMSSSSSSSSSSGSSSRSSSGSSFSSLDQGFVDICRELQCDGINVECDEDNEICVCEDGFVWVDENEEDCEPDTEVCEEGYMWNEDALECEDVDECLLDTDDCDLRQNTNCENSPGSYECPCKDGFIKTSGQCTPDVCEDGYMWNEDTAECDDVDECMLDTDDCDLRQNTNCENTPGSYECPCEDGFIMDESSGQCIPDAECHPSDKPCTEPNERCHPEKGVFVCVCDTNYERDPITNECTAECHPSRKPCTGPHEVCHPENGVFICICSGNYERDPTTKECIAECHPSRKPCTGPNEICQPENGEFKCVCNDNYERDPVTRECISECHPLRNPCLKTNERCDLDNGIFMCVCNIGLERDQITNECRETPKCNTPTGDPCRVFEHTQCVEVPRDPATGAGNTFRCDCKDFYIKDPQNPGSCKRMPDEEICKQHPCDNGGTCRVSETVDIVEMSCSCTDAFVGKFCEEPRNLIGQGQPEALTQGLMVGAIVAAGLLLALLGACCCLCACLPCCRRPPPPPPPKMYGAVARPRQYMRPYVVDGYEERWIKEERRVMEEEMVVEEPIEERREHWYLERSVSSDVESGEELDENHRINLLQNALRRASRNPLNPRRNRGYEHPSNRSSSGRTEFSIPYTADGSVNQ